MAEDKKFIPVDIWEPENDDQRIVFFDKKLVYIPFERILEKRFEGINTFSSFIITENVYANKLDKLCKYINYMSYFYDDDNELLMNYLKLKYLIDTTKDMKKKVFIRALYEIMFTDTIMEKVRRMVTDNFNIDLNGGPESAKYANSTKFTNEHGFILYCMSICTNIMIPILNHFIYKRGLNELNLYDYYHPLFEKCSLPGYDVYNKLTFYIMKKLGYNEQYNKKVWEQRAMKGEEFGMSYFDKIFRKTFMTDVLPKFRFDDNIISLISVIVENNLGYYNKGKYDIFPLELNCKAESDDEDKLSDMEKFEMSFRKIDESILILSEANMKTVFDRLESDLISDDEIEYNLKYSSITDIQKSIVKYMYAKTFNGFRDMSFDKYHYMKAALILKRKLQLQGYLFLPEIITARVIGVNNRTIRNKKFCQKFKSSLIYQDLINNKYKHLVELKGEDIIINYISTIINSTYAIVDYHNQERTGVELEIIQDPLAEELTSFLYSI